MLERLARDKHSNLLQKSVNYGRKRFYSTAPVELRKKVLYDWHCRLEIQLSKRFLEKAAKTVKCFQSRKFAATSFPRKKLAERHLAERHLSERHLSERHLAKRHLSKRHLTERHLTERHLSKRHLSKRHLSKRHLSERHLSERHLSKRHERHLGRPRPYLET